MITRRTFVAWVGASTAGLGLGAGFVPRAGAEAAAMGGSGTPFGLGIASGDADTHSVVLWTRVLPAPARTVAVSWQVAADDRFRRVVAAGAEQAVEADAHTVHAVARGLEPGRPYWYRFRIGNDLSPIGRTRTAPAPSTQASTLRFVAASCGAFHDGYWPAYRAIAAEDELDLVLFLGDYLYEGGHVAPPRYADRVPTRPENPALDQLVTLDDYRARYAQYKADPALQAAHAAAPWYAVPDDHEVENDYAGLDDEMRDRNTPSFSDRAAFARQRAAAYKAYWEHLPFRPEARPVGPDMPLYRSVRWGDLATIHLLDTRQYRADHPESPIPGDVGPEILGRTNPGTMLGDAQEAWLAAGLAAAAPEVRWQILGQQVPMAQLRLINPLAAVPPTLFDLDPWDGYGPARRRLLEALAASPGQAGSVVLTGDAHAFALGDLRVDFDDLSSPIIATEFVTPAISSQFNPARIPLVQASIAVYNPHVRAFEPTINGYLRGTVTTEEFRVDVRAVETVTRPDAPVRTHSSWSVPARTPS